MQDHSLQLGQVLYRPHDPIKEIYFPVTGLISWVSLLEDGTLVEIALVGNEGLVGLAALLGGGSTPNSVIVQLTGEFLSLDTKVIQQEFNRGGELQEMLLLFMQALLTQVAQNAACNRQHTTEARLARWLLSVQDRVYQEELILTHDFLAKMLCIRRASVTVNAGVLQKAGMIRYQRGRITILDRAKLEDTACECYRLVQNEYHRLLGTRVQRSNEPI